MDSARYVVRSIQAEGAKPERSLFRPISVGTLILFLFLAGCSRSPTPPPEVAVSPPLATNLFAPSKIAEIDAAISQAIADKKCPGGVLWLERLGSSYHRAYGNRAVVPTTEPMTEDTIFDAASLTKVIATTPAIMLLLERGQLELDKPVFTYLPEFKNNGKEAITLRHLMTHTSGLRPGLAPISAITNYAKAIEMACAEKPLNPPGTLFRYSDINFILLGEIVRRVSGQGLETFTSQQIYQPLGMQDTGFLPSTNLTIRIAPTEVVDGQPLRGIVHDPTSRHMGGVAGHAGLFLTAADLAKFARMMLGEGEYNGVRIFKPETVRLMTSVQSPDPVPARRGLGWDIDSPYAGQRGALFPLGGYGHTGWTGGSLWIDPFSKTFLIFLSNRNHPDESGNVIALRRQIATLAAQAVIGFDFSHVAGALSARPKGEEEPAGAGGLKTVEVLNGVDVLERENFSRLKGLRIGLITNHTGQDRHRRSTIDLLKNAPDVSLNVLFSPEHGIRGALDEKVGDSIDAATGLHVYSLYGSAQRPTPEQLHDLDALVYDIQDIGCRFYTYPATMGLAMEAAAEAKLRFFVLDRVNPIGGAGVEGPVYRGEPTFIAFHQVPLRHGMTVGELARMFNAERSHPCELSVVPIEGWSREQWYDQTELPWTNPSPNMRSLVEATLYPGVGLLETALSVGRGTGTPFEVIGAPYIDDVQLATELNRAPLPGVRFVPVRFTPTASIHKDQQCGGVQFVVTDREQLRPVDLGIAIVQALQKLYPKDFDLTKIDRLLQDQPTLEAVRAGRSLGEIRRLWETGLDAFKTRRAQYLLYK